MGEDVGTALPPKGLGKDRTRGPTQDNSQPCILWPHPGRAADCGGGRVGVGVGWWWSGEWGGDGGPGVGAAAAPAGMVIDF